MLIDFNKTKEITVPGMNNGTGMMTAKEEILSPGTFHICKKGSEHSIENTGDEDFVLRTVVVER